MAKYPLSESLESTFQREQIRELMEGRSLTYLQIHLSLTEVTVGYTRK